MVGELTSSLWRGLVSLRHQTITPKLLSVPWGRCARGGTWPEAGKTTATGPPASHGSGTSFCLGPQRGRTFNLPFCLPTHCSRLNKLSDPDLLFNVFAAHTQHSERKEGNDTLTAHRQPHFGRSEFPEC